MSELDVVVVSPVDVVSVVSVEVVTDESDVDVDTEVGVEESVAVPVEVDMMLEVVGGGESVDEVDVEGTSLEVVSPVGVPAVLSRDCNDHEHVWKEDESENEENRHSRGVGYRRGCVCRWACRGRSFGIGGCCRKGRIRRRH